MAAGKQLEEISDTSNSSPAVLLGSSQTNLPIMPAAAATTRAASDWSSRWAIFGIARCDWSDLRADAWVGQVVLQMFLRKRTDPEPIQAYRSCIVPGPCQEGGRLEHNSNSTS